MPVELVPTTLAANVPAAVGIPDTTPVDGLTGHPGGRFTTSSVAGAANGVVAGMLVAVIVKGFTPSAERKFWPTVPRAMPGLVMAGIPPRD